MAERFDVSQDGTTLAGERWPGGGQTVLLLHEGVADRRGWAEVAGLLAPERRWRAGSAPASCPCHSCLAGPHPYRRRPRGVCVAPIRAAAASSKLR